MHNVQPASHAHTTIDGTTQIVTLHPRRIALYHLTRFAKVCIMVAATITAILYMIAIMVGVPSI